MKNIEVFTNHQKCGELFFEKDTNEYGFNYSDDKYPISLIMPYKNSTYTWKNKLHPLFDMYMPEGYLFELFKNFLSKEYGYIDDYLIFSHLCINIQSRLEFKSDIAISSFETFDIEYILNNDSSDTFTKLVKIFMDKNAISGVQPKTLALIDDKESIGCKEYIIKTWGDEYPQLALNEYFCLKAVEKSGVEIPKIMLSKNNKFLLVQRFNYDKYKNIFLGFEEVLGLLGKNKDEKYSGSYEQISKVIYSVSTQKLEDMKSFYKLIIMNYLLKNGDAHLKNFGILYNSDFSQIYFAPAYDVVNTVVYFHKDRPALSMFGKKVWFGKKELVKFGIQNCYLNENEANEIYELCIKALKNSIFELEEYLKNDKSFEEIGTKMLNIWKLSLDEKTYKEIPNETI